MLWIVGIACFTAGGVFGMVVAACLAAAGRADDREQR